MELLGSVLNKIFNDLGIDKSIKKYQIFSDWDEVVGQKIAAVTEPQRISDDKIIVKVKNDTWRNELVFYKSAILKKIQTKTGSHTINDIIFI